MGRIIATLGARWAAVVAVIVTMSSIGSMNTRVDAHAGLVDLVLHAPSFLVLHSPFEVVRLQGASGVLRLRGAGEMPAGKGRISGKRRRETTDSEDDSDEYAGVRHQRWDEAPKRARFGGIVGSALSASYTLATLPFSLAYAVCTAAVAAPVAGVNWLFSKPKRKMTEEELLRFEGDEDKPSAVLRQISFYFSDSNLPSDSFLKGEIAKDPMGRVSLALVASFKRMRILHASVQDIAEAARAVPFLEVSEDGEYVRRTTPLPDAAVTLSRTVYAYPLNLDTFGAAINQVSLLFAPYGKVTSVRLVRSFRDRQPTGGVFVEFEDFESARKASLLKNLTCPSSSAPLQVCMKSEWKQQEHARRATEAYKQAHKEHTKKTRETEKDAPIDINAANDKHAVWVRVTELDAAAQWTDVSRAFSRYGTIKFVDMHRNNRSATVRFHSMRDALSAAADNDTPAVCGSTPNVCLVQGAEEEHENAKFKRRTQVSPPTL